MHIMTKLTLLLLCIFLYFQTYPVSILGITLLLSAIILTSLSDIIRDSFAKDNRKPFIIGIAWGVCGILSLWIPELKYYLPLSFFDLVKFKLPVPTLIIAFSLISEIKKETVIILLLLCVLTGFSQAIITKNELLNAEFKKIRDTSREHELLIEEKNRRLIEKQDAEIYTATLKERNRIAREIHDNVGHMLTRSILQVGAIKTINSNEVLSEPLESLHETLNTAMTNIRSSVHDLHDESVNLEVAIHEIVDPVEKIEINLQYDMSEFVPKNIKYCFISITKEAINNILKHSNATQADIIIQEHPAFYQLRIHDNGTDINTIFSEGMGLTNMRDRIRSLKGNLQISTDDGFNILISIIKDRSMEG